jgi:hypothetical protein
MKNILALALTISLCSCGFMTPTKQYSGEQKSLTDIAVINAYVGVPFTDEVHATISAYSTQMPGEKYERRAFGIKGFTDYPHVIHVAPGEIDVELYCFRVPTVDTHRVVRISARPGYNHLLKCTFEDGVIKAVLASAEKLPAAGNE